MTTERLFGLSWDDLRDGDLVTISLGEPGQDGHRLETRRVENSRISGIILIGTYRNSNWKLLVVTRETPDPIPDHIDALVLTAQGLGCSDGDGTLRWKINREDGHYYESDELIDPVEALPVPAKELRELAKSLQGDSFTVSAATVELLDATRREWKRAGIDGGLDD